MPQNLPTKVYEASSEGSLSDCHLALLQTGFTHVSNRTRFLVPQASAARNSARGGAHRGRGGGGGIKQGEHEGATS